MTSLPVTSLPEPRTSDGPYRIALVCLGNICRSAIAGVVLRERLRAAGLAEVVEVHSAGTGDWHVGGPMDDRAATVLARAGYDATQHRARQFTPDWLERFDVVLAMDGQNRRDLAAMGADERLLMFRDFDPRVRDDDRDVPDPYYGGPGGFDDVLATVERTGEALTARLARLPGTRVGG